MRLSKKFAVPAELALLYDFANSLDLRQYTEKGKQHEGHDELGSVAQLGKWMREHGLHDGYAQPNTPTQLAQPRQSSRQPQLDTDAHSMALRLRKAIRDYLQLAPEDRCSQAQAVMQFNEISSAFPLVVVASRSAAISLEPAPGSSTLARVLAELQLLAATSQLERLKMCASQECRWVFFDRSKPGNRRWCSSTLCGNRHKTRRYRQRRRQATSASAPKD